MKNRQPKFKPRIFMEKVKMRFWINVCTVALILINIIYCLILLVFSPVIIVGSFFWSDLTFHKVSGRFMRYVPDIPEIGGIN